jgi:hypothetical protein
MTTAKKKPAMTKEQRNAQRRRQRMDAKIKRLMTPAWEAATKGKG